MMFVRWPAPTLPFAAALAGIASKKEFFTMSKVIGFDPDTTGVCVAVMEDGELARKLQRVFQIFCRAQEAWAVEHDPRQSTGGMERNAGCSP